MSFRINTNVTAMGALRNLNQTGQAFSSSVTRLSTGMRINSAADDPAGLIFSENFRAQISGIDQAVRNNQDAMNYAKTAEGALDEISRLLREARTLAVGSANSAILSPDQLQANQTQLNRIVESVNRIASETAFGKKKLLDGSSGVAAGITDPTKVAQISLSGQFNGTSLNANGNIEVDVTTAATKATHTTGNLGAGGFADLADFQAELVGAADAGTFYIKGQAINVSATDTWGQVVEKINTVSGTTGVTAEAQFAAGNGSIRFTSSTYGTAGNFTISDSGVLSAGGTSTATGVNAQATVTIGGQSVVFDGGKFGYDGVTLADTEGNVIRLSNPAISANSTVGYVNVGTAQFQTGPNANNRANLNIGNFSAATLGIDSLDLTTAAGASDALSKVDDALSNLNRRRGDIGSFMRNVLESNVRSLGIAKENLAATESNVRDTDIANEMTEYTKLQILQQSGLAVLAQANQAPQSVLSLLRG